MKFRKVSALLLIGVLTIVSLAGCGSKSSVSEQPQKVRVGYLALPHYLLTPYVAEKGYDVDEGIELEAMNFTNGPAMIAAMQSDSLDIGIMANVPVINASATSPDTLYVVSAFEDTTSIMSLATTKTDIKEITDLKGKKVSIPLGTGMHFFLELALGKVGMSTKDLTLLHTEPNDAMYCIISGETDATVPFGGYLFSFLDEGGWPFFWGYELWETEPKVDVLVPDVIVVSKKFADKYPERVIAFLSAYYRGVDDFKKDPEGVLNWEINKMNEIIGTKTSDTQKKFFLQRPLKEKGKFEETPSWVIWSAEEQLELLKSGRVEKWFDEAANFFIKQGTIPNKPNFDNLINPMFMEQVVNKRKNI
ncbi:ABC transporter substrate-binding protein [Tepidanaerobacter acetatoxydans]|uniref:ABC transporter substrate-binding protein n=1 Tax=Tepidanaerobacter acetatoxydans TaxID=499229 RepID=UPI001BD474B5|nr:ABC transporter substrate-binding protein [Tepidanaerobacter acetatoxydans]